MRSVEEQLDLVLSGTAPLAAFPIGLLEARGCVIAEDVVAPWPLPAIDSAATDGYAVRVADVAGADNAPVVLVVSDVVVAGIDVQLTLRPGCAIRVRPGGRLPEGTEAIVPLEHTDAGLREVTISRTAKHGQFIRNAGEDVAAGETVITAGEVIDHRLIGLLAAIGRSSVVAHPRPRVVVLSIGNDLLDPGAEAQPGKQVDSNGPMLAAAVAECGAHPYRVGPIAEDLATVSRVLEEQLVRADLVLLALGAVNSAYEQVQRLLHSMGKGELTQVAMQPGSVQGFGTLGDEKVPVLVLPGHPVAALVSFEVFARPLLRKLQGHRDLRPALQRATALNGVFVNGDRRNYIRAQRSRAENGDLMVSAVEGQGPHLLGRLARTDCLIVVPQSVIAVEPGDSVDVLALDGSGGWQ